MAREDKRPIDPRDREPRRESGPTGDSHERGKRAASEQRPPSLPERNRKLGKRHDRSE